jgi:hypothetical protein
MKTPKHPSQRPAPIASPAAKVIISEREIDLLAAFRAMDERSQEFIGRLAERQAKLCPA